ncbi:MAG: BACON domain-containing carbohydrate-binding protein, partial [Acidobacteriota bacterium]
GKIPAGFYAGLFLAIALALACFLFAIFHKSSPPQSQISKLNPQKPSLKSQSSNPKSQIPDRVVAKSQHPRHTESAWEREERREEREREMEEMEEMEREREEAKERYDKPAEAARYMLNRRLPEGETDLRFELYQNALEQALDLPQYSTREGRLLPSLREMGREKQTNAVGFAPSALPAWTSLGPGNVGGRTRALLVHPRNPDTMFAGAASGGVWRTTSGGQNWTPMTDLMLNLAVNALAMDPNNPDIIYAGTGEGFFNADAVRGAGIFRSFDGGNTWRRLDGTTGKDFYYVNDIVVSKNNTSRIFAATRSGVMRSNDGGTTWSRVVDEERNNGCSDLAMRTDTGTDVVFAACGLPSNIQAPGSVQASIYRNDNAGALGGWEVVYTEDGMSRTSLAIAPSNQNVIYAVASENGATGAQHSLHAVFRSNSGGDPGSWAKVNDGRSNKLNASLFTNPIWAFQNECRPGVGVSQYFNQGWYDNVIAVDPQNENIVWVGGIDMFRSDDGGANWGMASFWNEDKTSARYLHADQHVISFHPQFGVNGRQTMYVGNDGGIFRTDNSRAQIGTSNLAPCSPNSRVGWQPLNNGYGATQFYHGAPFPDGRTYFGGAQDNGVVLGSDDYGPNGWRELLSGDGGYVAVDPANTQVLYAENNGLSLKKSTDGGKKWITATNGINNIGFGFIVPFAMDPSDPNRLWIGGNSLYRTKNGAESWAQASLPLRGSATAIAISQSDSSFVLAGTDQGSIYRSISPNPGPDTLWPEAHPRNGTVSSLAFDPSNRDIAYATYSNFGGKHVWRTVNGGANWQQIDGPLPTGTTANSNALPDIPVNCIVVDPTNTQRLYVATDIGVFTSPDGGATWAVENTGFTNAPVEWLSVGAYNGVAYLFAFSRGRGAWRVPLGHVCTYSLAPTSQTFDATGGRGGVTVTASSSECAWRVENNPNWIEITSAMAMQGSGAVSFNVGPGPGAKPRAATFTVAGTSITVTQAGVATCVSAASYLPNGLAPESIVTAYGVDLADGTQVASGNNLPFTLLNTSVKARDKEGIEHSARLFFVSPYQINFEMPKSVAFGPAIVTIYNGNDKLFNCPVQIASVAPGLFTANATGKGSVMGQALHYRLNAEFLSESLALWDASQSHFSARPIDLGPEGDQVYLVIYGTGLRFCSSLQTAKAKIGGVDAEVKFVGAQSDFTGLDQVNILLPRSLAGRGEVDLILTVDGQSANVVRVHIK